MSFMTLWKIFQSTNIHLRIKTGVFPDGKQLKDVLPTLPGLLVRTLIILLEIGPFFRIMISLPFFFFNSGKRAYAYFIPGQWKTWAFPEQKHPNPLSITPKSHSPPIRSTQGEIAFGF